jgi:hypothetical protein
MRSGIRLDPRLELQIELGSDLRTLDRELRCVT